MSYKLKKVALGFIILILVLIVVGYALPTTYDIEQSEHIIASEKMIFVFIGDISRWREWTTWAQKAPDTQYELSTPSYGVGAWKKWSSEKMGQGLVTITDWNLNKSLSYDLKVAGYEPSQSQIQIQSAPNQGYIIRWTMTGKTSSNPLMRYFGLITRWMLKKDLQKSLQSLKKLAESSISAEVNGPWHQPPPTKKSR